MSFRYKYSTSLLRNLVGSSNGLCPTQKAWAFSPNLCCLGFPAPQTSRGPCRHYPPQTIAIPTRPILLLKSALDFTHCQPPRLLPWATPPPSVSWPDVICELVLPFSMCPKHTPLEVLVLFPVGRHTIFFKYKLDNISTGTVEW